MSCVSPFSDPACIVRISLTAQILRSCNTLDRSAGNDCPSGEVTQTLGTYFNFEAACDAARGGLKRSRDTYTYYKESRTVDNESIYGEQSEDANGEAAETDDQVRDVEDFCIRTFHDHGEMTRLQ